MSRITAQFEEEAFGRPGQMALERDPNFTDGHLTEGTVCNDPDWSNSEFGAPELKSKVDQPHGRSACGDRVSSR